MNRCYFFKDNEIIKDYSDWRGYSDDNLYYPSPETYHWEVGSPRVLYYHEVNEEGSGHTWMGIPQAPDWVRTLILLLG